MMELARRISDDWTGLVKDHTHMSPAAEQLLKAAMDLPDEERRELVDSLLAVDTPSDQEPFDPAWVAEFQRRSAEIDAGSVEMTPWSVVRERVRRRLDGLSSD
jgi:putative addiction module component (TIGR02574 family)